MMPTHKLPLSPLSLNQLSELTGVGYRTLKKKLKGLDPEDEDGRTLLYNSRDALSLIYGPDEDDNADGDEDEEGGPEGKINGRYQLARMTKYKADHLKFDLQVKKGKYILAGDVETWLTNKVVMFKSRLRLLAASISEDLAAADGNIAKIQDILQRSHDDALNEMASRDAYTKSDAGDGQEADAEASSTAEADNI